MRQSRTMSIAILLGLALVAPAVAADEPALDALPDDRVLYIAPGQSLARLVARVYPERPGDWAAIREWIVDNNPHAFVGGDPDRLKADVRVRLPSASDVAARADRGATAPRAGDGEPALVFDDRFVFVDPSQSLAELVPTLYPDERGRWERIIAAIIERNARRLQGTDSGTVIDRGTRLHIPEVRRPPQAAAATGDAGERPEPGPAVAAVVARRGEVTAIDSAGRERALDRGDAVRRHDTLVTGPDARAKIRFDDGEQLFLRPASRVRVRDWVLPETGPGRRVVELVRGGLRAISGAIGNRSSDTYRTVTPQTTLGIRGTDYALRLCGDGECIVGRGDGGGALAAGLYVGVDGGRVSLLNESGEVAVGAGERRYVAGPAQAPSAAGPASARVLYTEAELEAGIGEPAPAEEPEAGEDDGSPWGWALLGLILLGAGL